MYHTVQLWMIKTLSKLIIIDVLIEDIIQEFHEWQIINQYQCPWIGGNLMSQSMSSLVSRNQGLCPL